MSHALANIAPALCAQNDDEKEPVLRIKGMDFTRAQIESPTFEDDQMDRIAAAIANNVYYEEYTAENRVRDLSESAEIVEALFNRHSKDPRQDAMNMLGQYGYSIDHACHDQVLPEIRSFLENLNDKVDEIGWTLDTEDEDEFIWQIEDCVRDILISQDTSKPTDILSSCDRAEIAFVFMPNKTGIYRDDYCVASHKSWADWQHLSISQGWLETLSRLGHTLTAYRKHSGNKHKQHTKGYRPDKRRAIPLASLDEIQELVENSCAQYFNFAIYAQVPLASLLNTDLTRPVVLDEYSLCTFSDSGTFHDIKRTEPIVLRPEDGIWHAFGKSGPDNWCGLSGNYYHATISN